MWSPQFLDFRTMERFFSRNPISGVLSIAYMGSRIEFSSKRSATVATVEDPTMPKLCHFFTAGDGILWALFSSDTSILVAQGKHFQTAKLFDHHISVHSRFRHSCFAAAIQNGAQSSNCLNDKRSLHAEPVRQKVCIVSSRLHNHFILRKFKRLEGPTR
jgi:hypothetical protein